MDEIKNQIVFLLGSFLSGVAVMFAYEGVNILRGLFRLRTAGRLIADVLFFVISGICVFRMIFLCNHGTIRSFFVFAFAAGALLYRKTFGTKISEFCLHVFRKVFHVVSRPFAFFCKKILKKMKKSEKKP